MHYSIVLILCIFTSCSHMAVNKPKLAQEQKLYVVNEQSYLICKFGECSPSPCGHKVTVKSAVSEQEKGVDYKGIFKVLVGLLAK